MFCSATNHRPARLVSLAGFFGCVALVAALLGGWGVAAPSALAQDSVMVAESESTPVAGVLGEFSALGAGTSDPVRALVLGTDELFVGGKFNTAGDVTVNNVAVWADGGWQALADGVSGDKQPAVNALSASGSSVGLLVGGAFNTGGSRTGASGVAGTNRIAAWAESGWRALETGVAGNAVFALAQGGDVVFAGGDFTSASGVANTNNVAVWAGDAWRPLGVGVNGNVRALAADGESLYAGGLFDNASGVAGTNYIAEWLDDTWRPLGTGMNFNVFALTVSGDTLYAGGQFNTVDGRTGASGVAGTNRIAAWTDDTWHALGTGTNNIIRAIAVDEQHDLVYVGGDFSRAGSVEAGRVAVWDRGVQEWVALQYDSAGQGVAGDVYALAVDDSAVFVGGYFTDAGSLANADHVARWTWHAPWGVNDLSGEVGDQVQVTGEGFIGVPASGGVHVGSIAATYSRIDATTLALTIPAGVDGTQTISITGVGGQGDVGTLTTSTPTPPPPPPPPVVYPPSSPLSVSATAGDNSAAIGWSPPDFAGTFPITTYQVVSSPGSESCLTTAPSTECVVTGLLNDTTYTFTARALNGAGWGPWSKPSEPVTPRPGVVASIVITGSRGEVRGRPGIIIAGNSIGLDAGTILRPRIKLAGESTYSYGAAVIEVAGDGEFTWQRRTGRKVYVYLVTDDLSVRSARVIIPVGEGVLGRSLR